MLWTKFNTKFERNKYFYFLFFFLIITKENIASLCERNFCVPPWWKLFFVWRKVSIPSKETHSSCLSLCKERHKETRVCRLEPWKQWYYTRSKFHLQDTAIRILFPKFLPCLMHSFPKFFLAYISFRILFLKFYAGNFILNFMLEIFASPPWHEQCWWFVRQLRSGFASCNCLTPITLFIFMFITM